MSVTVNVQKGIAEVYLDHPPVNALDSAGWSRLAETITTSSDDGEPDARQLPGWGLSLVRK